MYDARYDMHICFYRDHVDVENVNYEVSVNLPTDCTRDELSDLLRIAIHTLLEMQS